MAIERPDLATGPPAAQSAIQPLRGATPLRWGLEDLYSSSQRRLVIQVAALTGDVEDAEDIVQEAFGRCVTHWQKISGYDDPEAWVRSVAFNLARSRWRRLTRASRALRGLRRDDHPGPDAGNVVLMTAISRLPEDEREVLVRHHLMDLPVTEVASQLGLPEGTVKSRLARARNRLAESLGPNEVNEEKDSHG
jgi:RNA polymerase sigma-70 factor (ECF subfamily)